MGSRIWWVILGYRSCCVRNRSRTSRRQQESGWLRGVDSNHDSQIQSLESYRLDDPGVAARSLADGRGIAEVRRANNCNDVRW
jgi:hypothetical protein